MWREAAPDARPRSYTPTILDGLVGSIARFPQVADAKSEWGPPHAVRPAQLWRDMAVAEHAWLERTLRDIGDGILPFERDEDRDWEPPADDPGWQRELDRTKYRALLGRPAE